MKKSFILLVFALLGCLQARAQPAALRGHVRDAATGEALAGATISAPDQRTGAVSDENGNFSLALPLQDSNYLEISYVGYKRASRVVFPFDFAVVLDIALEPDADLEEITISSTRTNSRIEDLPVKVEVLGTEELQEEASLVPGGMGSLLGDLSIITIQRTGPVSGNDAVRMQGLAPGYTQLLQDGLPLYGGFSGSLGVLNIPPLDLRQVEIVKGSSSTLYGGGAIGGLINFLSKTPDKNPGSSMVWNQTSLGETDIDGFFSRRFAKHTGFTLTAAGTRKVERDLNHDGFAEVPRSLQLMLRPRWFWGLGRETNGDLGFSISQNNLRGGDFAAIRSGSPSASNPYYQEETVRRITGSGQFSFPLAGARLSMRAAVSVFDRGGDYGALSFGRRQINSWLEGTALWKRTRNDLVLGLNLAGEKFDILNGSKYLPFQGFNKQTVGVFAQLDHRFSAKWSLQTGLRLDVHTLYGRFLLPRAGILYKPVQNCSIRLGYGRGYKTPDLFSAAEAYDYRYLQPLQAGVLPDRANSLNMDVNYQVLLFDALSLSLNQAFYYVGLAHPFETATDSVGLIYLQNTAGKGRVLGSDSYVQMTYGDWELYFGYNHTLSRRLLDNGTTLNEPLNPQDKVAATLAWAHGAWRTGIETAYSGNQYVYFNRRVPSYWFWAAMVSYRFSWGLLVLNCENVGDARQSRREPLVTGGPYNPVFAPVWGPVEGRVLNLSVKVDW